MKQTIIADSTFIEAHCTCPQMAEFEYHQSLTRTDGENKDAIAKGTLGHKWLEIYYRERGLGKPLAECVSLANSFNPDAADVADNHEYPLDEAARKQVISRLQHYWMTYSANDYIPDCKQKHIIRIGDDSLPYDDYEKVPLVELGFSYELFNSPEYLFILEGRIDMITSVGPQQAYVDHKFQLRERNLYPKSIQFKNYAMVTGLHLGIINYIRLHQEVSNKTLKREVISFNANELRSWRSELIDIYVEIAKMRRGDPVFSYRRNRAACPGKFGYPCQFTQICEEPNRTFGETIKIQNFTQRKEWRPW